ncbi:MAG: hypothetical protein H7Y42_17535 [Chitinophagaceae bacterium]|nr:hypothetical protein [Chitinophagaceae bacterium]
MRLMQLSNHSPMNSGKMAGLFVLLTLFVSASYSQSNNRSKKNPVVDPYPATIVKIGDHLRIFNDTTKGTSYHLAVCADVPDNSKPLKVAYQQETGHVFIILRKVIKEGDTLSRVFGFYPMGGLQTLLFKKTRSVIKDNSHREYDVGISRELSAQQFDTIVATAISLADRKYHMNRYNCYDYALGIFNSVAGASPLPIVHVRFPFIFGRGGSPCSIYRSFGELAGNGSVWASHIEFADRTAPISSAFRSKKAEYY